MPMVFSNSSMPVNFERFQVPSARLVVRGRDEAGEAQDVADREFGRRDDVRGRRIDDHDARGGRGLDVDVVEADAGARDDLEVRRGGDRLLVDLRRRTDEDGARIRQRREQCGAIRAIHGPNLEVGAERLDGRGRKFFGDEHDRLGHEVESLCL